MIFELPGYKWALTELLNNFLDLLLYLDERGDDILFFSDLVLHLSKVSPKKIK